MAEFAVVGADDGPTAAAQYLEHLIVSALSRHRGEEGAAKQRAMVNRVLAVLTEECGAEWVDRASLADPLRRLLAVRRAALDGQQMRPDTPLSRSALLTGTRLDPSLASQLQKEIATADRVDILCSFIKWGGLRLIIGELATLAAIKHPDGPRIRVITTSYMGATDPRAVEALRELPNTEVRVSYDTTRTRLHAKAYLIHRNTGFGSAYVGSANLSRAALSEGLEWTSKLSQYELPHLWERVAGTFESYWNDKEFEAFTSESLPRLREAIERERGGLDGNAGQVAVFDLRPFPFQEEILDVIAAEREVQKKNTHLVVAATGTGKTMIAAFDYRRWSEAQGSRKSLLFVAHREELLQQALGSFRAVLRNQDFGDVLVGGSEPGQMGHLFCSIQSYNSRELWTMPPDQFEYVVVDEFHHAAAPSYDRLLTHVRPRVLLGLTATPERADGLDVYKWFGGSASAEVRLPDAIGRRLLCPFQYFGVSDSVSLANVRWQRGGYHADDLDRVFTGNDVRAGLVLEKVGQIVLSTNRMRAIGFCVSVAHAEFMAKFCNEHGLSAIALSAESPDADRRAVKERLCRREINIVFVVDLYNEGVDIPEVDTVLFLRPTESLTVFLQQLGRGLRLHGDKECLTVIDFIGEQRREFRYAPRLRALSTQPATRLDDEIEAGFPHLPAGCTIRMERVAQERVLANVRESLALRRPRMVEELRLLGGMLGRAPTMAEAIDHFDTTLDELLKRGLWSRLLFEAGHGPVVEAPDEEQLARGIRRLAHMDDPAMIRAALRALDGATIDENGRPLERTRREMFFISLLGVEGRGAALADAERLVARNPAAVADLRQVLGLRRKRTMVRESDDCGALTPHAHYTRDEILIGLGHWTLATRPDFREGVLHLARAEIDALFVTLNKTEGEYSPTTMYEDYAISDRLFHWQSQSLTSADSPTGQRYINHGAMGYTPLLFVRENRNTVGRLAAPYAYLGPVEFVSSQGSRPMSVVWRLKHSIPARLVRTTARLVG